MNLSSVAALAAAGLLTGVWFSCLADASNPSSTAAAPHPTYVFPPNAAEGGVRVQRSVIAPLECPQGCSGTPFETFLDYTVFIPDPMDEDEFPSGICELQTNLEELLFCWEDRNRLKSCGLRGRTLAHWTIAVKGVPNEVSCQKQYFKPFHRTGQEDDQEIRETDVYGDRAKGASRTYFISRNFVPNFRVTDMTITGDPWLTLQDGAFTGQPPARGTRTRYDFQVSARNRYGTDTVTVTIYVDP